MKNCSSSHSLLSLLVMLIILASIASPMKFEQIGSAARSSEQSNLNERQISPDYRVWKILRPNNKGVALAYVSVSPEHFNREAMTILAGLMNERFKQRNKIKAILYDDHILAKNYASGAFCPEAMEVYVRGIYFLDRRKPEEYIHFSSERNKPMDEITIKLSPRK